MRRTLSLGLTLGLVVFFVISAPQRAAAASIACTTADLIAAINSANATPGGATITLATACAYTLTAANNSTDGATGLPVITGNVSIAGSGATITRSAANGTPTFRIFDVAGSGTLTVDSLTISNGLMSSNGSIGGAGIYNHGTLSVSRSTFTGNSSPSPNGVSGGAISNSGNLTVTTTTFTNNRAQEGASIFNQNMATVSQTTFANNNGFIYGGGGVLNAFGTTNVDSSLFVGNIGKGGGAIDNDTTMTVRNSTFYNNSDNGSGGGAVNNFGTMTFIQTTFSGNKANTGANIHNYSSGSVIASTTLVMTILANPVGGSNCNTNGKAFIDNGYNLASDSSCGLSSAQHSLSNTNPQLVALASNGGATQTMALPLTSPAVNAIPTSFNGCSGSTDQRGVARPQGAGCDVGAFETIIDSNDTQPPTVPTGLAATSVSASSVSLSWNQSTDDVAVTGYTVYRNGSAIGSTGSVGATTYTDGTVSPATTYSYTVDAFDAGTLHSAQSPPLSVTTSAPPPGVHWNQSAQLGTGGTATSATLSLSGAVNAGDLLVGWFGQYNSSGQVKVSDNVNGAWIRGASETWSSSSGDLALYYVQNSLAAPNGVNITISSTSATYLEAAAGDYSGVALTGALDTASVAKGVGTAVDSGATAATGAGELVVGGIITGGSPSSVTPGTSQGQAFTMRAQRPSGSVDIEDVLSSAAGAQNGRATFGSSTDWYAVGAVFHQYTNPDAQPPTVPGGLTATASSSPLQVTVAWNASTDNVGVTGYTIRRNGAVLTSVSGSTLSYVDTTVASVATYSYTVDASDAAGNHSAQSSPATVTTPDTVPPTVPTGLKANPVSSGEVDLSWSASSDNVAVTGYTLYRNGSALTTTVATATSFADTTVTPTTTYTYTVDAFDAAGNHSAQSSGVSATTPGVPDTQPPSIPSGVAANAGPVGEVDVSWSGSTDNVAVTGYTVYRNGTVLGTVSASSLAYADKTAAGSTTYSYTVDAFDAAGNHSSQSAAASITTPDWTPPTTPTGLTASAVSSGEVDLSWSASSDNVAVTGYTVYRNGSVLITTPATTTSFADTTVAPTTTYTYTVDAFDAAGNHSARSSGASATTPGVPDTQPPSIPTGVAANAGPAGEVDVSWSASTDNVAVTGYTVYRNGTVLGTVPAASLAYADKTVAASTAYSYTVDAFDAAGNHSNQSTAATITTADWTPPTTPTGLVATVVTNGEIDLSWNASTDNVAVTGYTVYRNGVAIGTTAGSTLTYADTTVGHGFTYSYTIDAFDGAGNHSPQSTGATATTLDDIAPTTPGGFTAKAASGTSVTMSWSAATDNVGVTGYDVFRDSVFLIKVGATTLTYTDTVGVGSTHTYAVDAVDAAGNHSALSTPVTVTTPTTDVTPPTVPAGLTATAAGSTKVNLAWNASTDDVGVTGYTIYKNGTALTTVGASTLTYADAAVTPATNYSYTVDAFDAAGNHSAQSAPATVHVPGVPKFVQAAVVSTGTTVTSVTLSFGPVAGGDLLVGWFGQWNSTGQVKVSDNVNGAWTRAAGTVWNGGTSPGDVALYYHANSAAAPGGLTITISSTSATYLQGSAAEYSGVATVNPIDQVVIATGSSNSADSGLTAAVGAGELVYGGMIATNGPGTSTAGTSQGIAFTKRAQNASGSQAEEDITSSAAGQQHAGFTFPTSTPWFAVCAVFKAA